MIPEGDTHTLSRMRMGGLNKALLSYSLYDERNTEMRKSLRNPTVRNIRILNVSSSLLSVGFV